MGCHFVPRHLHRWRSASRAWCCVLAVLLVTVPPLLPPWLSEDATAVQGQDFSRLFERSADSGGGNSLFSLDSWLMKAFLIVVAFLAALLFVFLVIFRWLLTKKNPMWPLTAYGWCMSAVLTVAFAVAGALFWQDLVFGSGPLGVWGGRGLLGGAWLFAVIIVLSMFRSPHARKIAKVA